jgi:uncharacterized ParB-like nuclease family protein
MTKRELLTDINDRLEYLEDLVADPPHIPTTFTDSFEEEDDDGELEPFLVQNIKSGNLVYYTYVASNALEAARAFAVNTQPAYGTEIRVIPYKDVQEFKVNVI